MDKRRDAIEKRANAIFQVVLSDVIGLRSGQSSAEAAMTRLRDEYRQEMRGFRLVLYLKERVGKPSKGLYWGRLRRDEKTGRYVVIHIKGGLKKSDIYRNSEASRKERLLDYDRRRALLNVAHQECTQALESANKRWRPRANRQEWECQDPGLAPPALPPRVLSLDEGLLGDLWMVCQRLAATSVDVGIFCANYEANPIHKAVNLVHESGREHPHGRARWHHKGHPLMWLDESGPQERLTDKRLRQTRRLEVSAGDRKLLLGVENERRRLMRHLRKYTEPMNEFRLRSTRSATNACKNIAAAEGGVGVVA